MNSFFKALIAGWGAKKLGGGCLSTIVIFVVIYTLLGKCGNDTRANIKVVKPTSVKVQPVKSIHALVK
ncbi:hypothetical protein ACFQ3S_06760 [Mucilaginibacter terrae]|uniref:hypothetical protein n=1 Tax=Mucilaginibacter terrae TaxID=1955052 RepID=UPI00363A36C5